MKLYRLALTPKTAVRMNQSDTTLFRIPEHCPYTLKPGNTVTVKARGKREQFKGYVVSVGEKVVVKPKDGGMPYSVSPSSIIACSGGDDCTHKLTETSKKRLKQIGRYNDYKDELLAEARLKSFDMPAYGADITFVLPMPKTRCRWPKSRRKKLHMQIHQNEPDIDNLLKAYMDGLLKRDAGVSWFPGLKKVWVDNPTGWIDVRIPETLEDFIELAHEAYAFKLQCDRLTIDNYGEQNPDHSAAYNDWARSMASGESSMQVKPLSIGHIKAEAPPSKSSKNKIKCPCPCHKNPNIKHTNECCDHGYITIPFLLKQ
jgi:Holliday junction resolvase RusA-like endonuclease